MGLVQTYGHEPDPAVRLRKKWGARMKATRKTLDLTLEQLADLMTDEALGHTVTAAAISQWERGVYTPRYHHQIRWCEVTGRPHAEVFDMTEAA